MNDLRIKPEAMTTEGIPATLQMWTDAHAYTVIGVSKNGHYVVARRCNAKRIDNNGMSDAQAYEYTEDLDRPSEKFFFSPSRGVYKGHGGTLVIGRRRSYHDYSF